MTDHAEPLTPAVLHILLVLANGPAHGYAIMQQVDDFTQGRVPMGPGTLYGSIKRMLATNLICEVDAPADEADSRRKYYALTQAGERALGSELQHLSRIVTYARTQRLLDQGQG